MLHPCCKIIFVHIKLTNSVVFYFSLLSARPLSEPPENPASLVALQCVISPTLMRPDPLAGDHIATRRTRHEVPRLPSHDASEDPPPPGRRGQRRVPDRPAARPRWRRESRPETPSAESPWDGYAEDPGGRLAGGTPPARLESESAEAEAAAAPV